MNRSAKIILLAMLTTLLLAACTGNSLIGTWDMRSGMNWYFSDLDEHLEFFDNGKASIGSRGCDYKWHPEDGRLEICGQIFGAEVNGDWLHLQYLVGEIYPEGQVTLPTHFATFSRVDD